MGKLAAYPLDHPGHGCGAKGVTLGRMARMGLPILGGYHLVWDRQGRTALELLGDLRHHIPFPWIIRSSSCTEDLPGSSFAGLFASSGPIKSLTEAVDFLTSSLLVPEAAVVYARRLGVEVVPPSFILQPFEQFRCTGVFFAPDPLSLEGHVLEWGAPGAVTSGTGELFTKELHPGVDNVTLLSMYSRKIRDCFEWDVVDIEWGVREDGTLVLLQARSIPGLHEPMPQAMSHGRWRQDIAHNPRPLTPLHRSIVEHVHTVTGAPIAVYEGYLYDRVRADGEEPEDAGDPASLYDDLRDTTEIKSAIDVFARFTAAYLAKIPPAPADPGTVTNALLLTSHRILKMVREMTTTDEDVESQLMDLAMEYLGVLPVCWDIGAQLYGEKPELVGRFVHRLVEGGVAPAGQVQAPGELDDVLFARALYHLRTLVLERAATLVATGTLEHARDVFFLTLPELLGSPGFHALHIPTRKKSLQQRLRHHPPETFVDGKPLEHHRPSKSRHLVGTTLVPGFARGHAWHLHDTMRSVPPRHIVVAHSLTPQDILLLGEAEGLVLESASRLSHGAIIAMELGIPTVVGVAGARRLIAAGRDLELHGGRGEVFLL